jgi:NhaP-type Na+/H+ and K+/H+ antiporter
MKILLGDFNAKVGREDISNRRPGMRFYMRIVMIMVLELLILPNQKI